MHKFLSVHIPIVYFGVGLLHFQFINNGQSFDCPLAVGSIKLCRRSLKSTNMSNAFWW